MLVTIIISIIVVLSAFVFGCKHPSWDVRNHIERQAIQRSVARWQGNLPWKCIKIIPDYPGIFGSPMSVAVMERNSERVLMASCGHLSVGDEVILRLRNEDEHSSVSFSMLDEYMVPVSKVI